MLYQRKDQDPTLYESYSKSEDEMVEKYVLQIPFPQINHLQ
jgi:hypothetical protein